MADYAQSVPVNMQLTDTQGVKPSATANSSTTVVAENTHGEHAVAVGHQQQRIF